ncbi:MAG: PAS domain S-box protein [Candidatus Flexifilum sp.]
MPSNEPFQRAARILVDPPPTVIDPDERDRVRTLCTIVLLILVMTIATIAIAAAAGHPLPVLIGGAGLLTGGYALIHAGRLGAGVTLILVTLFAIPPLQWLPLGHDRVGEMMYLMAFSVANILLAYFWYGLRAAALLIVLALLGALVLSSGTFIFTLNTATMILFAVIVVAIAFAMRQHDREQIARVIAALRLSEQRYRAIVDAQEEKIVRLDAHTGAITFANDAYCRYHDLKYEEIVGQRLVDILPPEHAERVRGYFARLQETGGYLEHVDHVQTRDGRWIWLRWTDRPIYDDAGNIVEYQSVAQDITAFREAEAALRLTEQRYQALLESKSEVISRWTPDQTITYVNDAYCRYLGLPAEAVIGRNLKDLADPRERDFLDTYMQQIRAGAGPYVHETPFYSRDGTVYWMQWHDYPIYDEQGRVIEYQSFGRDVTERRRAEEALRLSEAYYRAVVETQREVICRWKPDTTLTFVNDAYCKLHDLPREELLGQRVLDRIQEPERTRVAQIVADLVAGKPPRTYENRFVDGHGVERWMQWDDRPIYNEQGEIVEFQTVGRDISELKRTLDALHESRQRLEALVNNVNAIVWEIDAETRQTYFISASVERILGYTTAQIKADPYFWRSRIYDEDRDRVVMATRDHFLHGTSYAVEYRMWTADERLIWLRDIGAVFTEPDRPAIVRGVSVDITADKAAQQAEAEARAFAEALRDAISAVSSSLDLDEVLARILDQVGRVLPNVGSDIVLIDGEHAYIARAVGYDRYGEDQVVLKFRPRLDEIPNFRMMKQTGQPRVVYDAHRDPLWVPESDGMGRWKRSYVGAPIRLEDEVIGFINVNSDRPGAYTSADGARLAAFADQVAIAIRNARLYADVRQDATRLDRQVRERTEELRLERERLRAILDGTGEGILYAEGDRVRFVNAALCTLTGYPPDELIDRPPEQLFTPDAHYTELIDRLNTFGAGREVIWRSIEAVVRRKDGTTFDAGLTLSVIAPDPAAAPRSVTIVRDISQDKRLQQQRSAFVAHASHELRTPLTNIKTRLYLLQKTPERLAEHVRVLESVTDWMQRLIEDLLDLTRFERGAQPLQMQIMPVCAAVQAVLTTQLQEAERKGLRCTFDQPPDPVYVLADEERLRQVFTNLIVNAINYTPAGGSVRVTVEADPAAQQAVIRVIDTGIGIAPGDQEQIFQPFYRVVSEVEGTGLGLSIARTIVEAHGGTIAVESAPGSGSTFIVRLPLAAAAS